MKIKIKNKFKVFKRNQDEKHAIIKNKRTKIRNLKKQEGIVDYFLSSGFFFEKKRKEKTVLAAPFHLKGCSRNSNAVMGCQFLTLYNSARAIRSVQNHPTNTRVKYFYTY